MPLEAIGKSLDRMEVNLSLFHTTVGKGRSFVKRLFFTLYAAMFHLFRVFPVQKKRVALISMHNADFHDSLGEVERAFREKKEGYFFTKRAGISSCKRMRGWPLFCALFAARSAFLPGRPMAWLGRVIFFSMITLCRLQAFT